MDNFGDYGRFLVPFAQIGSDVAPEGSHAYEV
jgi:hypothetical protein